MLDGDCDNLLAEDEVAALFETAEAKLHSRDSRQGEQSLGQLSCRWIIATGQRFDVGVFPIAVVPQETVERASAGTCDAFFCENGQTFGQFWVVASGLDVAKMASVVAKVGARVEALPVPTVPEPADLRVIPACEELTPTVASVIGDPSVEARYTGDFAPNGAFWDILATNGLIGWCNWVGARDTIQGYLYPDLGHMTDADIASLGATRQPAQDGLELVLAPAPDEYNGPTAVASTQGNSVTVTARDIDGQTLVTLAAELALILDRR